MNKLTYQSSAKQRLDKYLNEQLTDLSRSQIQKFIKEGRILVNGRKTSSHYFLKNGEEINLTENKKIEKPASQIIEPEIIKETDNYLIINKPAGLTVHGAPEIKDKTLTDWLVKKYPTVKKVGESTERPGIVHRLDKKVSGIIAVALTQPMFVSLKNQFQQHTVDKDYLALTHGQIEADYGIIDFPLKRSKLTGKIAAVPKGEDGREALTEFTVIQRFVNYTYLKVKIKTGRTHQIRVHLKAYGHPLVGDQ